MIPSIFHSILHYGSQFEYGSGRQKMKNGRERA
jgi:hypothetical protein